MSLPAAWRRNRLRGEPAGQEERRHQAAEEQRGHRREDQEERGDGRQDQERDDLRVEDQSGHPHRLDIAGGTITGANLAGGTVTGSQIAGGTVTGANINATSTPFSQAVARLRTSAQAPFVSEALYPIGSYTQPAGEDDQYLASLTVQFAASCGGERKATAYLLRDAPSKFSELTAANVIGIGIIEEEHGSGPTTRAMEFLSFPLGGGFSPMSAIAPTTAMPHSFSIALLEGKCETGTGVTATGGAVDIIGTK